MEDIPDVSDGRRRTHTYRGMSDQTVYLESQASELRSAYQPSDVGVSGQYYRPHNYKIMESGSLPSCVEPQYAPPLYESEQLDPERQYCFY